MLTQIIATSLMITGIHVLFWEGMLLHWMNKPGNDFFMKPIYRCLMCMASLWGFIFWVTVWDGGFTWNLIPFLLGVCGLNAIIDGIIQFARNIAAD